MKAFYLHYGDRFQAGKRISSKIPDITAKEIA